MEEYFKKINKHEVLLKEQSFSKSNGNVMPAINVQTRIDLVRIIADFVIENFGSYPGRCEKLSTARAAVALLPQLKYNKSTGDGTVSKHNLIF